MAKSIGAFHWGVATIWTRWRKSAVEMIFTSRERWLHIYKCSINQIKVFDSSRWNLKTRSIWTQNMPYKNIIWTFLYVRIFNLYKISSAILQFAFCEIKKFLRYSEEFAVLQNEPRFGGYLAQDVSHAIITTCFQTNLSWCHTESLIQGEKEMAEVPRYATVIRYVSN